MKFRNVNIGLLIIRLMIGGLMLFHGIAKIQGGISGIQAGLAEAGLPSFIGYGVFIGEIVAPLMIILGYKARIGALILLINMLVVFFIFHPQDIFAFDDHGGWKLELAGFYLFGSLALLFTGAGKFALTTGSLWD